jgi:hypothetical protein
LAAQDCSVSYQQRLATDVRSRSFQHRLALQVGIRRFHQKSAVEVQKEFPPEAKRKIGAKKAKVDPQYAQKTCENEAKCIPSLFHMKRHFLCVKQSHSWAQISPLYIREDDMLVGMEKYSAYKK